MDSVLSNDYCAFCNPLRTVEVFDDSLVCPGCENNIFIGPPGRVAGDFQYRGIFINAVYGNILFCDIARPVDCTELIGAVFRYSECVSRNT